MPAVLTVLALILLAACDHGPRSDGLSEAYDMVRETDRRVDQR